MNPLVDSWGAMDARRKLVVIGSILISLVAMVGIWRLASQPTYSLLYAGLDAAAAGEVISALEQRGVAFDVQGNAIYVADQVRDSTRLALASEGLPASGGTGYELLDSMTGFGTTAQMFDAAYWRAKEGELARTILANPEVRAARVHIASPGRQPFGDRTPVTASVALTPGMNGISAATGDAIRNLVAFSVAGLAADNVTIIDTVNGVLDLGGDDRRVFGCGTGGG